MKKDDKRLEPAAAATREPGPETEADKPARAPAAGQKNEPVFAGFDDDEDYEEPDRDTDYAAAYQEDADDDDDLDLPGGEDDERPPKWPRAADDVEWSEVEALDDEGDSFTELESSDAETGADNEAPWEEAAPLLVQSIAARQMEDDYSMEDDEDDWDSEDEDLEYEEEDARRWPLGLIAVGVLAVLLLAAGGYGVIQQRSAMQEEIRQLQASLATSASPARVAATREALEDMNQRNTDQLALIDALNRDNRRLTDIVAGLELQLESQKDAITRRSAPRPAAAKSAISQPTAPRSVAPRTATIQPTAPRSALPRPAAAQPATAKSAKTWPAAIVDAKPAASSPDSDNWFVNFGTYSQRTVAESWRARLRPAAGKVIVAAAEKDGASIYRVRVTGLANRAEAEKVSRELEDMYDLPRLWVGKK